MGTGEASRQSLSQSPVLGRHGNKQRGAGGWGRGARERQTGAKLSLIWLHAATMTPALWDPVCFTGQWTQSLFSSPVPLTQTGSTPLKHTHTHTHTHIHPHTLLIHPHTHTLSLSHTHTHKHRAYRSLDTGNTGTQGQCSHTRHMERVGTAQSPS